MSEGLADSSLSIDGHTLAPSSMWVYIADLTGIPACRAFAKNLLEQLHGAVAECYLSPMR
ncbi:hypothetical protein K443DRAFT_674999 [Laccaria amethystina LaAM-08-1]|uniref:Uncharacterized protein n=1 Tax=Laccaria amethystina LaAM-08-1 TaxID=1095629 RepID=A0A0C9XL04_9AGAR|nr:hypothetical protein K443DRAFT_674999 [Laccaria amethystina LaAM-08-1]